MIVPWKLQDFPPDEDPSERDTESEFLCLAVLGVELSDWYIFVSPVDYYDFYIVHRPTGKRIGIGTE